MSEPQPDVDAVTGLPSKSAVEQLLDVEWRRTARDNRSLAALLIEVDDFEPLAREYGPDAANECLRRVGRCIRRTCHRAGDVVARFDDAQFLALLPRADDVGAGSVAERLRRSIANLAIPNARSSVGSWVTVSVGAAATLPANTDGAGELLEICTRRLEEARRAGKNRRVGTPPRTSGPIVIGGAGMSARLSTPVRQESAGTVLIADDTASVVESLSAMLTAAGCGVRVARSGEAALVAVQRERPDLVLLDIALRDANGFELCRRLKATPGGGDLPVIFIGPDDAAAHKQEAFDAGAADYIYAPFQSPEVAARVKHQLEIVRLAAGMRAMTARLRDVEQRRASQTTALVNDLRAPLAAVQAALEAIRGEAHANPESVTALTGTAAANVKRIMELVTDVLDSQGSNGSPVS